MKKLTIAIGFDGTIFSEKYPNEGVLMNGAKETIIKWFNDGHTIIINTCRSGIHEVKAAELLDNNRIPYEYINNNGLSLIKNTVQIVEKISADIYIDDKNAMTRVNWKKLDTHVNQLANQKPLTLAIVGPSGAGKTTLAEFIEKEYGITMVESHTDRAKRTPNESGHTFHTKESFDKLKREDMIAYTDFGNKRYCCLKQDLRRENTYVIDERGLSMLNKDDYDIVTVRLWCRQSILGKRIGKERAARDRGMFSWFHPLMLWFSRYMFYVNTSVNIEESERDLCKIIDKVLKNRA
jgi:ribose 1,5-bisphosphokinase PhnN